MKLWLKFTIIFSTLVILGGGFTVVYLSTVFLSQFRTVQETHLLSVAEISKEAYAAYSENNISRAVDWSLGVYLRNTTEAMLSSTTPEKRRAILSTELGEYLRDNKVAYDKRVLLADIIDEDGIVVASSREGRIGTNEGQEERDHQTARVAEALHSEIGKGYISTMISEMDEDTRPMTHVTVPVFSTTRDSAGNFIPLHAVILVHFSVESTPTSFLSGVTHENPGHNGAMVFGTHYSTGEVYLARTSDGVMLTVPHKGKEGVVLKNKVSERIASLCASKKEDFHGEYLNYEGTPVMGAMECVEDGRIMLFVEISETEALAPFHDMQRKIVFAIIGVLFFIVVFSVFVSKSILRPLNDVIAVAGRIANKDMSARVKVRSKNEIGQLGGVFNQMLDNIAGYQKDISSKSEELTAKVVEFEKQNNFLKDVRKAMLNLLQDSWELSATLKKEKERSMSIITSMSEGLVVVNAKRGIVLMNPTAERLLEVKQGDVVGKDATMLWRMFQGNRELLPEERMITRTLNSREAVTVGIDDDILVETPSGRKFPIVIATTLLSSDGDESVLVMFRDVTEEKALSDAKSSFISIASHQLRTPLTSIRWYSEVLSDGSMGPLNEMQADFLKEIYQGSIRLFRTIDTLLALSRVESGKFEEHPVVLDARVFAEGTMKELEPLLKEKNITTHIEASDGLPNVLVDAFMLKEVLTNLLANSIRYTNDGGVIDVSFKKEDDHVICSVRDNGIGIPDDQKEKIFNRFFRANNAVSKVPDGSGLGLSLVKELVEKWGGKVWFESKEGEGTTFFITIPVEKSSAGA